MPMAYPSIGTGHNIKFWVEAYAYIKSILIE